MDICIDVEEKLWQYDVLKSEMIYNHKIFVLTWVLKVRFSISTKTFVQDVYPYKIHGFTCSIFAFVW